MVTIGAKRSGKQGTCHWLATRLKYRHDETCDHKGLSTPPHPQLCHLSQTQQGNNHHEPLKPNVDETPGVPQLLILSSPPWNSCPTGELQIFILSDWMGVPNPTEEDEEQEYIKLSLINFQSNRLKGFSNYRRFDKSNCRMSCRSIPKY